MGLTTLDRSYGNVPSVPIVWEFSVFRRSQISSNAKLQLYYIDPKKQKNELLEIMTKGSCCKLVQDQMV